ncbi:hypothetical protein RM407_004395 [Enterobacter kobei]|nr:hypothetical protein [Enterobacter kobei]
MDKKTITIFVVATFFLTQVFFIGYLIFRTPQTLQLECSSSFERNTKGQPKINYSGQTTLILTRSGEGSLYIIGKTDEIKPRKFHYAYYFDYHIEQGEVVRAKIKSISNGISNDIPMDIFNKQFFELKFMLIGGLRINMFHNVYILSIPGAIVNTCAPV